MDNDESNLTPRKAIFCALEVLDAEIAAEKERARKQTSDPGDYNISNAGPTLSERRAKIRALLKGRRLVAKLLEERRFAAMPPWSEVTSK